MPERWPPIYDANELTDSIRRAVEVVTAGGSFYSRAALQAAGPICQGDVVAFHDPPTMVVFDETGQPAELGEPVERWLVIGNTCDYHRPLADVRWSQIVPVVPYDDVVTSHHEWEALTRYTYNRRFYLPPWRSDGPQVALADFTMPMTIDKRALGSQATVAARLSLEGWILLHACLVRFLCRDDGRFDNGG